MKTAYSILLFFVIGLSLIGIAYLINPNNNPSNDNTNNTNNSTSFVYQGFDRSINRYYSSSEQAHALFSAETENYKPIFNSNGITGGGKDIWVEYINNDTLSFLDSYGEANKNDTHVTLEYNAWVYEFNGVQLIRSSKNVSILANGINYATKNASSTMFENDNYSSFYYYNSVSNSFNKQDTNFTISYASPGFIVDMKLKFDNIFGPLAATISYVRQTLIMDSNYQILHIFKHNIYIIS